MLLGSDKCYKRYKRLEIMGWGERPKISTQRFCKPLVVGSNPTAGSSE